MCYDLNEIYTYLNRKYFKEKLELTVKWFGNPERKARHCRTLGAYYHEDKLIKIHKVLNHPDIPVYFVLYVVYHEMLHHVCPPKRDKKNKRRSTHHKTFRECEKNFDAYVIAKKWEKENKERVLTKIPIRIAG